MGKIENLTVATTSGVDLPPFQLEVLKQAHVVQLTRAARKGHNSWEQKENDESERKKKTFEREYEFMVDDCEPTSCSLLFYQRDGEG